MTLDYYRYYIISNRCRNSTFENQTYSYLRPIPAEDINKDRAASFLDLCIVAEQWCEEQ